MVELFIMEYMTVLCMTIELLLLDSRYSRRRTVFIVSSVTILLMAAVSTSRWFCSFSCSAGSGGLRFQQLSAVLFCMLIHHRATLICYLSSGRFWVLVLSSALDSSGFWFAFCDPYFSKRCRNFMEPSASLN